MVEFKKGYWNIADHLKQTIDATFNQMPHLPIEQQDKELHKLLHYCVDLQQRHDVILPGIDEYFADRYATLKEQNKDTAFYQL
jgi:hypothetical protein